MLENQSTDSQMIYTIQKRRILKLTENEIKKQIQLICRSHCDEKKQIYEILGIPVSEGLESNDIQKIHDSIFNMLVIYIQDATELGTLSGYLRNFRKNMNKDIRIQGIPEGTHPRFIRQLYLQLFIQYLFNPEIFGLSSIKLGWKPWEFLFILGRKRIVAKFVDNKRLEQENAEFLEIIKNKASKISAEELDPQELEFCCDEGE